MTTEHISCAPDGGINEDLVSVFEKDGLGDCKAFAFDGTGAVLDLDPYVNPHEAVLQEAIAALGLAHAGGEKRRRCFSDPVGRLQLKGKSNDLV
jgi:hypothetical protein